MVDQSESTDYLKLLFSKHQKLQPLVAEIGWSHNIIVSLNQGNEAICHKNLGIKPKLIAVLLEEI